MPRIIRCSLYPAPNYDENVIGELKIGQSRKIWVKQILNALARRGDPPEQSPLYCRLWMAGWIRSLRAYSRAPGPRVRAHGNSWNKVSTNAYSSPPSYITDRKVDHLRHA